MRRPELLARQDARPTGWLGRLVGRVMTVETAAFNDQAVEQLDPGPSDRVLEIGFGPGRTLGLVAARVPRGRVAGLDLSETMVRRALRRHRSLVATGHLELRRGAAELLPRPDECFDKVLSVHTLYFWERLEEPLAEIHRVLRSGGRLVLGYRYDEEALQDFPPSVYRFRPPEAVIAALGAAGFHRAETHEHRGASRRLWLSVATAG